jgi:ABC-type multidrug transport system fused ATPase/permease subunit
MNNIKLKAVISVLLIFIAGMVVGGVLTFLLVDHEDLHFKERIFRSRKHPERNFFEYLSKELELSLEQEKEIKVILRENHKRFKKLEKQMHAQFHDQFEEIRKNNNEKIMAILNDEQKTKYRDFIKKVKQKRLKSKRKN